MFQAHKVPVGKDQIQHIEMARDIAMRFNHTYGTTFILPEAVTSDSTAVLQGLDGRKMSKSYNNTITLFIPAKRLRKLIMKIKTNSQGPEEPKDPDSCTLFQIYRAFAQPKEIASMRTRYAQGIAWGAMKQYLFEYLDNLLAGPRARYDELKQNPDHIEKILQAGARKAREYSRPFLAQIRQAIGVQAVGQAPRRTS
jgi:tryptophanyl-tRNA synthetase